MTSFVGFLNNNNFILYDDENNRFGSFNAKDVRANIDEIWNMEIKNGKPVAAGISMDRFNIKKRSSVTVAVKVFIDAKGNVKDYILVSDYRAFKISKDDLLNSFLVNKAKGQEMGIANLKFIAPDGKKPYVIHLGNNIPSEVLNQQKRMVEEQIVKILTYNLMDNIIEVSDNMTRGIDKHGINPFVDSLEKMGINYNHAKHSELVKRAISNINCTVYYWKERNTDESINFIRYSCNKEKLMIDMSNHLSTLPNDFNRNLYKFGQLS